MSFGLLDLNNVMKIKTKSCDNGTTIFKVDGLGACYLNHCSKIMNHGKMSFSNYTYIEYLRQSGEKALTINLRLFLLVPVQDFCSSNPCQYGSCTTTLNGYECSCSFGYYGPNCRPKGID